ncbi:MAG: hypothetical protein LWX83_13355 [Anaerolineae bacterium]|nr:hypothetical protein [Anaerolineae bacterium]
MNLRKILFVLLIVFLLGLVLCALIMGGYTLWGKPLAPQRIVYPTVTPNDDGVRATLTIYEFDKQLASNQQDDVKWFDIAAKEIELDPDNYSVYLDRARKYYYSAMDGQSLKSRMELLSKALTDNDKATSLAPDKGVNYLIRAIILSEMATGYSFRVDKEIFKRLALENANAAIYFGTSDYPRPGRLVFEYEIALNNCDRAKAEVDREAEIISADDVSLPSIESMYESVYACQGDYQKALEYYRLNAKKRNLEKDNVPMLALYLYQAGKVDEALDLVNKSINDQPFQTGQRYFIRAVIEYNRGQYEAALADADLAESNLWAGGMFTSYFNGLEAARQGRKEEAILYLQHAEATLPYEFDFAIARTRTELKKLQAEPLSVTPSVHISVTPLPTLPVDIYAP